MIAQCMCYNCCHDTPIDGNLRKEDLIGTPLEYLLTPDFTTEKFEEWYDKMVSERKIASVENERGYGYGGVYNETTGFMENPKFLLLDEFDRWERDGQKCPVCGSTNNYWY